MFRIYEYVHGKHSLLKHRQLLLTQVALTIKNDYRRRLCLVQTQQLLDMRCQNSWSGASAQLSLRTILKIIRH